MLAAVGNIKDGHTIQTYRMKFIADCSYYIDSKNDERLVALGAVEAILCVLDRFGDCDTYGYKEFLTNRSVEHSFLTESSKKSTLSLCGCAGN